jgi:hypothetical protein
MAMKLTKFNPASLPYLGAIVQAGLFGIAGYHYFKLGVWGAGVGLGVGVVVSLSLAFASSRVSEIAQKRQGLARLALLGMFTLSPVTITLSLFAPSSVAAAIAWASSPDLAIVLAGAIAGKSLVAQSDPLKQKSATERPAKSRSAEIICRYAGAGCGRKFASQNAANAHAAKCGFKPTIAMPVDVSKKVEK